MAADVKPEFKLGAAQRQDEQVPQQESNVRTQIIDQVKSMVGERKSELVLQLKPYHLGGLSIALTADDKGVVAKLMTASKDAHNMLRNEITSMQEMLREKGINVVQMEVIYDQMANSTGKDSFHEQGHGWEQTRRGNQGRVPERVDIESAILMYDDLSTYDILAEQGGSVEFSA
jgi:flagellar hook-length control protein FliK